MPDDPKLTAAKPDDLHCTLRHALLFKGRKPFDSARASMADLTAEHLIEAMGLSGYMMMKQPPAPAHSIDSSPDYGDQLRVKNHLTD